MSPAACSISAGPPTAAWHRGGAAFVNQGTIHKFDAAVVTISRPFNNTGSVIVEGGTLSLGDVTQHSSATLTGGLWEVRDGATLTFSAGSNITTNQGTVILRGPTSVFVKIDSFSNNQGRFEIHDGRNFTRTGTFNNSGQVVIGAGSTLTTTVNYLQSAAGSEIQVDGTLALGGTGSTITGGSILSGNGQVTGPLLVSTGGIVAPGASAGTLTVGDFTLDGGVYEWELDPADQSDTIVVAGTLTFGSAATLKLVDSGGSPDPLTEYVLFSYAPTASDPSNPAWTFDTAQSPVWDASGASVIVDAANDRVVLTGLSAIPALPGDFNNDGVVDAADYVVWRNNEGTSNTLPNDPVGGTIGQAQYDQWRAHFGQSAGSLGGAAAAPEPPSMVAVVAGGIFAITWLGQRPR